MLAFWVIGLLLVAVLMAYRQLAGLQLQVLEAEGVFVGQFAECRLHLRNNTTLPRQLLLQSEQGDEWVSCMLAAKDEQSVAVAQLLNRRGRHPYGTAIRKWS